MSKNLEKKDDMIKEETNQAKSEAKNIDLTIFNKQRFTINGDPDKFIELDPSDFNIITRVQEQYPKLTELTNAMEKINLEEESDEEIINKVATTLKEIDNKMRKCVNTIFDYDVCTVCVPSGSMYDIINGKMRYEYIIDTLGALYTTNFDKELNKIQKRAASSIKKYSKK